MVGERRGEGGTQPWRVRGRATRIPKRGAALIYTSWAGSTTGRAVQPVRLIFIYRWLGIESHDSSACTTRKRREGEGGLSLLSPLLLLPFHSVSSRESGAERGSRNGEGGSDAGASTEPRQGAAGALRCLPIAPPSSLLFLCLSVGSASSLCHLPQSFNAVLTYG